MSVKFKYALPILQMLLAVVLLVWTEQWGKALARTHDMPGTPPPFSLLVAINAPVALPRALWFRYLPGWWDDMVFVAAIGMFWYWVALNIYELRQRRAVCSFAWKPLRLASDLVLVGVGAFWAFVCTHEFLHGIWPHTPFGWPWDGVCIGFVLAWSLALIFFFGRDLIHYLLGQEPLTRSEAPSVK